MKKKRSWKQLKKDIYRARAIYLMILPVVVWFLLFQYWPMTWLSISFFDYNLYLGFVGSKFVGFQNFIKFFTGMDFWRLMRNVLLLNFYALLVGFPAPIIFALFLNEMRSAKVKKVIQTVSFLPYFISMVAFVSLVTEFLSPSTGLSADILKFFGKEPIYFLGDAKYFRTIMVFSGIWQTMAAQGRTAPLVMAGPPGLTDVVRTFYAVAGPLPFELRLKELPDCKGEFEVPAGCVQAFPLKHRVPCCGYAFTLPRAGKFDPQRAKAAGIPVRYWSTLQSGQLVGGFLPSQVLGPPRRGLKVVYATDTRPCAALRRAAQDADLLLMDSTYADDADLPKAKLYGHSTCRETGVLAAEANVCRLWLTHYSAAVTDLAPGLAAAQQAFPTAAAGVDGMRLTLNFDPD